MYFVYYSYDYDAMGGVGLESFETSEAALTFIEARMRDKYLEGFAGFTLIEGKQKKLITVETITKIGIED